MSRRHPTFKPGHFTVAGLKQMGWDIISAEQQGKWAVLRTAGELMDTPNERGDHVAISPVTLKIRMYAR